MKPATSLQEAADKIMKSSTRVIGAVFEHHAKYFEQREGKKGIRKIEEKMAELGYPIRFKDMQNFEYYPVGLADLSIIAAKEIFGWTERDVFDMGNTVPKYSLIIKLLLKYFISLKRSVEEASRYWRKHFTAGKLEYELHEEKKYVIIRLRYKTTHPLMCIFYAGYFLRIAQYVVKSPKITIKETRCMFKDAPYHEYTIRWN